MRGEYISRDGIVFAGFNADNGNSILQRKIQIRQLETESVEIRSIVQNLEKQKDLLLAQVGLCLQTVREKRDSSQRMQVNASTLHGQLSLLDRELREAEGKVKSLNWERNNVQQRLDAASGKVDSIEQELSNGGRELDRLQSELATSITAVDSLRRDEETLSDVLNELKVRVATERQKKENLQQQRQPMAIRLAELQDLIVSRRRDIASYTARIEQFAQENATLRVRMEQLQIEQAEAEAGVGRILQDRAEQVARPGSGRSESAPPSQTADRLPGDARSARGKNHSIESSAGAYPRTCDASLPCRFIQPAT